MNKLRIEIETDTKLYITQFENLTKTFFSLKRNSKTAQNWIP